MTAILRSGVPAGIVLAAMVLAAACGKQKLPALDEVFENLDKQSNTDLHVEEYWKTVNGKDYTAAGRVVDVRRDREGAEVFIAVPSRITLDAHNVVLLVPDVSQAAALKRRETVRFKGFLSDYKCGRNGGVVLTLKGVDILK